MTAAVTLTQSFLATVARHGERPALSVRGPAGWTTLTYAGYGAQARHVALALVELGIGVGDRVALLAENRPEWVVSDQAILMAGAVTVPLYPTLTGAQSAHILNDCGARLVILSSEAQLAKLRAVRPLLHHVEHVVVMDEVEQRPEHPHLYRFSDLSDLGTRLSEAHATELERRIGLQSPGTLATMIYTSGTTGDPKGAMLTHGNLMSNVQGVVPVIGIGPTDEALSFLPLSHVLERTATFSLVSVGAHIYFARSVETVGEDLVEVRPTLLTSVPRLFEKIRGRILDKVAADPLPRRVVFDWACRVGDSYTRARLDGRPRPFDLAFKQQLADTFVFSQIRARTGGRLRLCLSGGAPLAEDLGRFFAMVGIEIIEGYGLTETSPVVAVNRPGQVRYGTVGHPLAGVEVRLADDGELLVRGPNVMKGYFNQPEATAAAIDPDGWFHTGDVAEFDPDGRIRIVDRKKEIIVMSNGKNVAPQPIENALKASRLIDQVMLVGDRRPYITALVVPQGEALRAFAAEQKLEDLAPEQLLVHPQVQALYAHEIDTTCRTFARFEQVKRFRLLPRPFDGALDELTPTLKLKRRVIANHFSGEIEALYAAEPVSA
ncbi:MAG: long-chain fatty acid--CoA ligase [Candidatus Sericytochromatia bacterium]|nr:long-chain fatty acid--CoA ligase [Candidatus Sericytochromatia bacterium]